MEILMTIWSWLTTNFDTLLATAFIIEVAAVTLVNLTPTPVDNRVLTSIHKVLVLVANIIPNTKVQAAQAQANEALKGLK